MRETNELGQDLTAINRTYIIIHVVNIHTQGTRDIWLYFLLKKFRNCLFTHLFKPYLVLFYPAVS